MGEVVLFSTYAKDEGEPMLSSHMHSCLMHGGVCMSGVSSAYLLMFPLLMFPP